MLGSSRDEFRENVRSFPGTKQSVLNKELSVLSIKRLSSERSSGGV